MNKLVGIDEAGRGAWAGPLTVGVVILGDWTSEALADSKLLDRASRKSLAEAIYKNAVSATVGWVSPAEIDEIGLTAATTLAIRRALEDVEYAGHEMVIDGHINYFKEYAASRCLIKADRSVPAVSAASIIAKVARDEYMAELSVKYPDYGFEKHVGYGTKIHSDALAVFGVTDLHRLSYKPILAYGKA